MENSIQASQNSDFDDRILCQISDIVSGPPRCIRNVGPIDDVLDVTIAGTSQLNHQFKNQLQHNLTIREIERISDFRLSRSPRDSN